MASSAQIPSPINEAWFIISYFSVDWDIYFDFPRKDGCCSQHSKKGKDGRYILIKFITHTVHFLEGLPAHYADFYYFRNDGFQGCR